MTFKGIWTVGRGKGDRHYVEYTDIDLKCETPSNIANDRAIMMYGYDKLKDLAVAILLFEKEENQKESIQTLLERTLQENK